MPIGEAPNQRVRRAELGHVFPQSKHCLGFMVWKSGSRVWGIEFEDSWTCRAGVAWTVFSTQGSGVEDSGFRVSVMIP